MAQTRYIFDLLQKLISDMGLTHSHDMLTRTLTIPLPQARFLCEVSGVSAFVIHEDAYGGVANFELVPTCALQGEI